MNVFSARAHQQMNLYVGWTIKGPLESLDQNVSYDLKIVTKKQVSDFLISVIKFSSYVKNKFFKISFQNSK